MQAIHIPDIKATNETPQSATFTVEPLQRGYGVTLGNSLRRVLLSSLSGAAATAFSIEGASHEFTTIEGIKEDVLQITLNLKRLNFRVYSDEPQMLKISKKGKGQVTGADITANSEVEVVNQDQHIATLDNDKSKLEMTIQVEKGRGYTTVDERQAQLPVDMIGLDAMYSPIERVRYKVENTRVGQVTDLDKLIVDVETDGTIAPSDAIEQAATILVQQFEVLTGGDVAPQQHANDDDPADEELAIGLDDLELSSRTTNALQKNDINTVGELAKLDDSELKNLKGFGAKAYEEVAAKLKELELK